jgi:hypothetical protein
MEIAWTVIGIAVPSFVTLGYTFVGLTPPEFRRARFCFIGAAVALGGMEVVWYTQTGYPFFWRVLIAVIICLIIGIGLPETPRWVHSREAYVASNYNPNERPVATPPAQSKPGIPPPKAPPPPLTAEQIAEAVKRGLALGKSTPTGEKVCMLVDNELVNCTDAEIVAWGRPLLASLGKAIQTYQDARIKAIHGPPALNNKLSDDATLNMYLRDTAVRLKVEENQLVNVFSEIGFHIEGLKGP